MASRPSAGENLSVRPFHWETYYDNSTEHDRIVIYAMDRESSNVILRVENFPNSCQLELPIFINKKPYEWTPTRAAAVVRALSSRLERDGHQPFPPHPSQFRMWKRLYYDWGRRFPMMLLLFKSGEAMRHASNILKKPIFVPNIGDIKCSVHETDVKMIVKFITQVGIHHTSWFHCEAYPVPEEEKISNRPREYYLNYHSIVPVPEIESLTWYTFPKVFSYDIETYTDRHQQLPDRWNPKHPVYIITVITQKLNTPDIYAYALIYGECDNVPLEKVPAVTHLEIIKFTREVDLIDKFCDLMIEHDPDVITGHNILGYDNSFLDARLKINFRSWPVLGRLRNHQAKVNEGAGWSSSASKFNILHDFYVPGRLQLDMMHVIKREGYIFVNYDLDTLSHFFLKRGKHDMPAKEMFVRYEGMRRAMKRREVWLKSGTDKFDLNRYNYHIQRITEVLEYGINDSVLVLDLFKHLNVWLSAAEMSNASAVSISDFYMRGQQIRVFSRMYMKAVRDGIVLTTRELRDIPYEGGAVRDPIPGLHDNVLIFDFESLYPSITNAFNICYTHLVPPHLMETIPDEDCLVVYIDVDEEIARAEDERKGKIDLSGEPDATQAGPSRAVTRKYGVMKIKFTKQPIKGLMPGLSWELIETRRVVKDQLKNARDPISKIVLDRRQLAIKIVNNSGYGFTGAKKIGLRPCVELAMTICYLGRTMIGQCGTYLREKYNAVIVYGDTDSVMVVMPDQIKTRADINEWGYRIAGELTNLFPEGINMQFENKATMFNIGKKMYGYYLIDDDGFYMIDQKTGLPKLAIKGLLSARRDNCSWARDVFTKILRMCLDQAPFSEVINFIFDSCQELFDKKIPLERLTITRVMGASYASDSFFMKVFADNLRAIGRPPQPGDRLQYIVYKKPDEKLLGNRMMLASLYREWLGTENEIKLDLVYYVEKVLRNAADRAVSVAYKDIIAKLNVNFRPTNRHKPIGLNRLVEMIAVMRKRKYPLEAKRQEILDAIQTLENPVSESDDAESDADDDAGDDAESDEEPEVEIVERSPKIIDPTFDELDSPMRSEKKGRRRML